MPPGREFDTADVRLHHEELQPCAQPHPAGHTGGPSHQQMGALVHQEQRPARGGAHADDQVTSQPEFLPVTGEGRDPMPESQALVRLIDELRPAVQFSLHGVEVGGSFL